MRDAWADGGVDAVRVEVVRSLGCGVVVEGGNGTVVEDSERNGAVGNHMLASASCEEVAVEHRQVDRIDWESYTSAVDPDGTPGGSSWELLCQGWDSH